MNMKSKFTFFFLIVSSIAYAALKTEKVTITFSENDFSLAYNEYGHLFIESKNLSSYPETNEPGLPLFSTDIAVPKGCIYVSSNPQYNKRLLKSDVEIAQSPMPVTTDNLSQDSFTETITYNKSSIYPYSNCCYMSTSIWDNIAVLHFLSCPFIYDSKEKKLYFIDSIDLTITILDEQPTSRNAKTFSDSSILKSFVLDSKVIDDILLKNPTPYSIINDRLDYVIITNQALKSSFNPLLQWKKTKGLYSQIITIEDIESNYSGSSTPLKLKKCLYDLYSNKSLKYVLLGGDDTVVPVQGCYGYVSEKYTDTSIPTDLYYACFGGNFEWDENGNGIYGETGDNINLAQSIYVTRVPVRLPADVDAFVNKLFEYEKNPHWTNQILMCGCRLWGNISSQSDAEVKGDNLYDNYIKPYWNGKRYKFYDTYTDFPGSADYSLSPTNLTQQLSKGFSFMDMATHGSQTTWSMESGGAYNSTHGNLQTNIGATIMTTMACSTNAFDTSNKGRQDPCLSESLIRNPSSGVIAYLGCSRYGWGSGANASLGTSFQYESHFYKNLFSPDFQDKNYGVVVAAAKTAMISRSSIYGSARWVQFGLNPIGDPEMPIYTEQPKIFNNVSFTTSDNSTVVNTGVPDCRICVMSIDDDGSSYYKVYENSQSVSLSDLPVKSSICITKQGYIPKQYSICLIQDETLTGTNVYNYDVVKLGSSLTSKKTKGSVIIKSGKTTVNAATIIIDAETKIEKGAEFILTNQK